MSEKRKRELLRHVCLIVLLGTSFLFFLGLSSYAQNPSIKLSVTLDKNEYGPQDPINITFKLQNIGKSPVYVNKRFYLASETLPEEKRDIYLIVTSPSGEKLASIFSYPAGFPKTDYFQLLGPGQEAVSEYARNLKGYFEFKEAGTYKVVAVYKNVYGKEIGLEVFREKVVSGPISFKIIKANSEGAKSLEKK